MYRNNVILTMGLAVVIYLVGCGGGSSGLVSGIAHGDQPPGMAFNPGTGNNPGGGGTPSTSPPLAGLMDSSPIVGASENAPLGTNPDYHVEEVTPQDQGTSASRITSALGEGESFMVYRVTVAADGEAPDFDADPSSLAFYEGQSVDLWVEYEGLPGTALASTFAVDAVDFSYSSNYTVAYSGLRYLKLPLHLFYLEGNNDLAAKFTFSLGLKSPSAVVLPDTPISKSVDFTIKAVATEVVVSPGDGWQVAWETQLVQTDYDYNDLVVRMSSAETKIVTDGPDAGKVCQIEVTVKALARGDGYSADWQFNLENPFPGANDIYSYTQLYKGGTTKTDGPTRVWHSTMGVCIPVFTPVRNVLPSPPGHGSVVNTQKGQPFVNGGYAKITILFPTPCLYVGQYRPAPYTNQMLIENNENSEVWVISLTTNRGGNKIAGETYPLGFILPAEAPAYSWPLEGVSIVKGYPKFADWVQWWNASVDSPAYGTPEPQWWNDEPVPGLIQSGVTTEYYVYSLTSDRTGPSNLVNGPPLPIGD